MQVEQWPMAGGSYMTKNNSQPTDSLISALAEGSSHVADAATELSNTIRVFENWLTELPGKTTTTVVIQSDDRYSAPELHLLRFHRQGKSWVLSEAWHEAGEPEDLIEWSRLNDAPIEIKIIAAKAFPELLQSMRQAQASLGRQIIDATNVVKSIMLPSDKDLKEGA
jgi:hypothetical protein